MLASKEQEITFNNIGHIIDLEMLTEQYKELSGKKAIGIDGVTKEEYGKKLEENLSSLLARIRRGQYTTSVESKNKGHNKCWTS